MELESENGSWTLIRWYRAEVPCEVSKKFGVEVKSKVVTPTPEVRLL